jgi:hypothetical protein
MNPNVKVMYPADVSTPSHCLVKSVLEAIGTAGQLSLEFSGRKGGLEYISTYASQAYT